MKRGREIPKKRIFMCLLTAFIYTANFLSGQGKIDSLKKVIKNEKSDSLKAADYLLIARIQYKQGLHDSGIFYAKKALTIGENIKSSHIRSAAYSTIGVCYHFSGDYKNALSNYILCIKIEEAAGHKIRVAKMLNNIGAIYADQKFFDLAEKSYLKSYKISEEINDTNGILQASNILGALYGIKSQ